jgi:hypothetical protein
MTESSQFPAARSGVYRTPADVSRLESQSREADLAWLEIQLDAFPGKRAGLNAIAKTMGAPAGTFGENWDALADVLQDLSWDDASGHVLHLRGHWDASPDDRATLVEVLRASADYWRSRSRAFLVFLDDVAELPAWT